MHDCLAARIPDIQFFITLPAVPCYWCDNPVITPHEAGRLSGIMIRLRCGIPGKKGMGSIAFNICLLNRQHGVLHGYYTCDFRLSERLPQDEWKYGKEMVEMRGIEPLTSALRTPRSPN